MRPLLPHALAVALLLAPTSARALEVKANGYVSARNEGTAASDSPLGKVATPPAYRFLGEANGQLRLKWSDAYDAFGDVSLFFSKSTGDEASPAVQQVNHNTFLLNELYANLGFTEQLAGLVGKKRLLWGSGFVNNPTDLINPPKDPTDPAFQRAGQYLARLELTRPEWAATLVFSPQPLDVEAGLPRRLGVSKGGQAHYAVAARYYRLIQNSDVNLMTFFTQRYNDDFQDRVHFGASFSRYFFTDYELHLEALVHRGASTTVFNPACVQDLAGLAGCVAGGTSPVNEPDRKRLTAKILLGTRYQFSDESLLSVEYLFNGEGLHAAEFSDRLAFLKLLPLLPPAALLAFGAGDGGQGGALPNRFSFDPARRHYLFLLYSKPRIRDDFTLAATGLVGLEDLSGLVGPSLTWSAKEWLNLALYVFLPFGRAESEFGILPFRGRATFEARVFY